MAYSRYQKGTKYHHDGTDWRKLAMWSDAETIEVDGAAIQSNLPAAFAGYATLHAWLAGVDTAFGQANGFATLGGDGKVTATQLPTAVASGAMHFVGGQSLSGGVDIETIMNSLVGSTPAEGEDDGAFFIVTVTGDLNNASGDSAHHTIQSGAGDEGDDTFPVTVEQGDWVVLLDVDATTPLYTWGIINNDFKTATTSGLGAVQLSDATTRASLSGDHAVTEGVLSAILNDDVLVDGDFASAGFMKTDGSGGYSIDNSTFLTQTSFNSANPFLAALEGSTETSGLIAKSGIDGYTIDTNTYLTQSTFNSGNNELAALQALADTAGFLKKTGDATYSIDTNTYLQSSDISTAVFDADFTADGFLKRSGGSGSYTVDTTVYQTKVTIDAGAPSGGADNDLWIVTS